MCCQVLGETPQLTKQSKVHFHKTTTETDGRTTIQTQQTNDDATYNDTQETEKHFMTIPATAVTMGEAAGSEPGRRRGEGDFVQYIDR